MLFYLRASMCGSRFPNRAVGFNLEAAQNGIVHCAEGLHPIKTCSMTLFSLQQGGASSVSIMSHFPCCATAAAEVLRAALIFLRSLGSLLQACGLNLFQHHAWA